MSGTVTYEIDYRQVNINVGDCEFVLLIQNEPGPDPAKPILTVKYATLIDGGNGGAVRLENIQETIEDIGKEYGKPLQLDSIVITHWDADHYAGVFKLLKDELDKLKPTRKRKLSGTGPLQPRFLKYDAAKAPQTILYVPYFQDVSGQHIKWTRASPDDTKGEFGFEDARFNGQALRICKVVADKSLHFKDDIPKSDPLWTELTNPPQFLTSTDKSELIGRNLFNDQYPGTGVASVVGLDSPKKLLNAHRNPSIPGLYCVAVNNRYIKAEKGDTVVGSKETNVKNRSSIICMVIRPNASITHYLAGDASLDLEARIIDWTGLDEVTPGLATLDDGERIAVVKSSHHGSTTSTPINLCQTYKPKYIIFSAGNEHVHPRWETLFYAYSYFTSPYGRDISPSKPLRATSYPYWVTRPPEKPEALLSPGNPLYESSRASKSTTYEPSEYNKAWRESIQKFYGPPSDFASSFDARTPPFGDDKERVNWLVNETKRVMGSFTLPTGADTLFPLPAEKSLPALKSPDSIPTEEQQRMLESFLCHTTKYVASVRMLTTDDDTRDVTRRMGVDYAHDARMRLVVPMARLATTSSKVLTATPGEEDSISAKCYITSSRADPQARGESISVPLQWDAFVAALPQGYIALADQLTPATKSVAFDRSDGWQKWLTSAIALPSSSDTVQLSVTAGVVDSKLAIENFNLSISSSRFSLSFLPSRQVGFNRDPTFDPLANYLLFELDEIRTEVSFANICELLGISIKGMGFAVDIVVPLDRKTGVWFSPQLGNYMSTLRIQGSTSFQAVLLPQVTAFLQDLGGLGLWSDILPKTVTVVFTKKVSAIHDWSTGSNRTDLEVLLSFDFDSFATTIWCGADGYILAIRWKKGALDAFAQLLSKVSGSDDASKEFKDVLDMISDKFDILRILVDVQGDGMGGKPSIKSITVDAQLKLKVGKSVSEEKDVIFMLDFTWPGMFFRGRLHTPYSRDDSWKESMPFYEDFLSITPAIDPSKIQRHVSLLDLIPGVKINAKPPQGIPIIISNAEIAASRDRFALEGVLVPDELEPDTAVPWISFDRIRLNFLFWWDSKEFSLDLSAVASLRLPSSNDSAPERSSISLSASVTYESGQWTLAGELSNINFGDLLVFFHADEHGQVADVLGNVSIRYLRLNYQFAKTGEPTKLQFDGSLQIAALELDFQYTRDSDGWKIEAGLSAAKECTISDVIASICGDDSKDFEIPDFIGEIKLNAKEGEKGVSPDSPVYLTCTKPSSPDQPLVFAVRLTLGKVQLSFIQVSGPKTGNFTGTAKRILMFSLGNFLPSFKIPVIGELSSPIDGLEFIWVHDKKISGLTRAEVEEINTMVFSNQSGLILKESKASGTPTDIMVTAGCHFLILSHDGGKATAVLDYNFGASKGSSKSKPANNNKNMSKSAASPDPPAPNSDTDSNSGGTSKAAVNKSVGPLSVSNLGLKYKNSTLTIVVDAMLKLGPIEVSLLGFGLGVKLVSDFFTNFDISNIHVELRGLGAAVDKPPDLILAGMFEDLSTDEMELFAGGIAVTIKEYSLMALGSYGSLKDYKTFFLFAQLHGPLVELEFVTINGVSLGFGYNSHVTYPKPDEIVNFPLIKGVSSQTADAASSSSNVLSILSDDVFKKWITPKKDSFWFAIGLEALAFEVLDVRALAIVELDPYFALSLFADATCSLPPKVPREQCFVYVELGISSRIEPRTGLFSVDGMLSPSSFIIHRSCSLAGGFALRYWFDPSPYAGDFVYTIGGYHSRYTPPSHYPRPKRLSITWKLDNEVSIRGEAFFAITPKVCMGGGRLEVVFNAGPIRAHLEANAEFLMVWDPFHFTAEIGVTVVVQFDITCQFTVTPADVDVSATLELEGPPFGGQVKVNFGPHPFTIHFGNHPKPPPPLTLDEFVHLLSRSTNQGNKKPDSGITFAVSGGYAQEKNKSVTPEPGAPWVVSAGTFSFAIQCRFVLSKVQYNSESTWEDVYTNPTSVYSKPMHNEQGIDSVLKITIRDQQTSQDVGGFLFKPILKNVPSALWAKYNPDEDPVKTEDPSALLNGDKSTVNDMLTGMRVMAPKPHFATNYDEIPPYNALDDMCEEVIPQGEPMPPTGPASTMWAPKPAGWNDIKKTWGANPGLSSSVADSWAKAFNWKDKQNASPPAVLVDKFEEVYLSCPGVSTAA